MINLSSFLLANNYLIPIVASVAALVLLILLMVFTVYNMRKKKSAKNSENVSAENTETSEEQPVEELPEQIQEETSEPQTSIENTEIAEETTEEVIEETAEVINEKVIEEITAEATVTSEDDDDDDDTEDLTSEEEYEDAPQKVAKRIDGAIRYIIIKYNKSFTAKLIQSDAEVKNYYSVLKNELLSYQGVKTRMSWKGESFYIGRKTYAKLVIRGKCVGLFLALDANDYAETKYKVDDMSEVAAYEKIPCLYRIKNERRLKYAADLIAAAMNDREKTEDYVATDYAKQYPYEKIEPLIERKLVKVLTEEDAKSGDIFKPRDAVTVSEADELMQDEIAVSLIEETDEVSDKTKVDIVNIDTLSKHFADGETVTLEEIKKRIASVSKKATAIKVLARGKLDKKLIVIADSFSIEAAKMILLTGGNAIKKKNL